MKIVFMGTPDFAVPVLSEILKAGHQVGYVITQPDKAKNRGKKVQFTPVKELAIEKNIPVLQPVKLSDSPESMSLLKEYGPDIIVVVAYGQLLKEEVLNLPKFGCINVHGSLLPRFRGASPIQHVILAGDEKTGITVQQMEKGLDTGDMLTKAELSVDGKNYKQLHDELSALGATLLVKTLDEIEAGNISREKQDDSLSTYAGLISKQDGRIDFSRNPEEIERQIRAFDPWPGAFCTYDAEAGTVLKIWSGECIDAECEAPYGTILGVSKEGIDISCGGKILRAREIQFPGKKRVDVKTYLLGNKIEIGRILG